MKKRGFTLMELAFVISIIAILAAILFPVFAKARESGRRATCASNLSQIGMALNMYAQNYNGYYPKKNNEFGPLYRYVKDIDIFYCPSDSAERYWDMRSLSPIEQSHFPYDSSTPRQTYSSYVYLGGLSNDDRADRVIAGESKAWHGEIVNVLYLGGYARGVPVENYKPVTPPTQKPVDKSKSEPSKMPKPPSAKP